MQIYTELGGAAHCGFNITVYNMLFAGRGEDKWHNMASSENGPSPTEGHGSGDISSRSPAAAQKPPMLSELKVRVRSHVYYAFAQCYFYSSVSLTIMLLNRDSAFPKVCPRDDYPEQESEQCRSRPRTVIAQVRQSYLTAWQSSKFSPIVKIDHKMA